MYKRTSTIIKGRQMGRQLGFHTANLIGDIPDGVYCGYAFLEQEKYKAVIFSGAAPTFNCKERTFEVHFLYDFGGKEFYGQEITVLVEERIRDNEKFAEIDQLKAEIKCDCAKAEELLL